MADGSTQGCIRPVADDKSIRPRVASTGKVRVEFLRRPTEATVHWQAARPEVSLVWVRDKGRNARITVTGHQSDGIAPGRTRFWFFPGGFGAEGQLTGRGAYDCAGVFVEPTFLPAAAKRALAVPVTGFPHDGLARAFDDLAEELAIADDVLPLFTEGWAMQALAYVARASRAPEQRRAPLCNGLAPWQLRRAKEMLRANLSQNLSLQSVAQACRLSVSHFTRAFKASTGVPPYQWLIAARIENARDLLTNSTTPIVEIAGICGFADQSHFSRMFARMMGTSPGAWRREYRI